MHAATHELLLGPDWARITLGAVAERAGVQPSTLYRRWGTLDALLVEVHETRLADRSPLPDTGSLDGDLRAWADGIAQDLSGDDGPLYLRVPLLLDAARTGRADEALPSRVGEIETLLRRAADRDERVPALRDVFELLISPLYGYALFGPAVLPRRAQALVDRLMGAARS